MKPVSHLNSNSEKVPVVPISIFRLPTYSQKFRLGQGYNSLLGSEQGFAVVNSAANNSPRDVGPRTVFLLQSAYSVYELSDKLSFSASASFSGVGGGASANFSFAKSLFTRSESIFLVVSVDVRNAAEGLDSYLLEPQALRDAHSLSEMEFFKKYGDQFISAYVSGGKFRAVVEILNDSYEEKQEMKVHVDGNVGSYSASADLAHAIDASTANKRTRISVMVDGGNRVIDLSDLTKEASAFSASVAPTESPIALEYELKPFNNVSNWPHGRTAPSVDAAFAKLSYLKNQTLKVAGTLDNLALARENPRLFESYDPATLEKLTLLGNQAFHKIDLDVAQILQSPTSTSNLVTNYLHSLEPLPVPSNPATLPIKLSLRSKFEQAPTVAEDGAMIGNPDTWIQDLAIAFVAQTSDLSVRYTATFLHVFNQTQRDAPVMAGADGTFVGGPEGTQDFYALHSISISLNGSRVRFYDVVYRGRMSDGSIIEKRNGDILEASGPEFDDSPGASNPIRVIGVQIVRLGPIQPKSVIKQLSVEVKRRVII